MKIIVVSAAIYCYIEAGVRENHGAPWYIPLAYVSCAAAFSFLVWAMERKDRK